MQFACLAFSKQLFKFIAAPELHLAIYGISKQLSMTDLTVCVMTVCVNSLELLILQRKNLRR